MRVCADHGQATVAALGAEKLPGEGARVRRGVRQGLFGDLAVAVPSPGEGSG